MLPRGIVLVALTAAALGMRLALAGRAAVIEPDGAFYGRLAQESLTASGERGFHEAWPPLLPRVVAWAVRAMHPGAMAEQAEPARVERVGRMVVALLGALLVWPVYFMASRVIGGNGALVASLLVAFHPRLLVLSTQVLTEIPFALLVTATLALLGSAPGDRGTWMAAGVAAAAGACGAAAYLTRPEGIVLLPLGLGLLLFVRVPATRVGAYALAFIALAAPHASRVTASSGHPSLGAKIDYNLAMAYAGAAGVARFDPTRSRYNNLVEPDRCGTFVPERIPRFALASFAARHPGVVARHAVGQAPETLGALFSLAFVPWVLLAIAGVAFRRSKWTAEEKAWLATWAAFVLMYSLVFVYRRFFTALVPLLLIEAAAGVEALRARWPRAVAAAVVALLLAGPILAWRLVSRASAAREQRAIGVALLMRHPLPAGGESVLENRPRLMARKPFAAYYGGLGIIAMAAVPPESLAAEAAARGAAYVLVDDRDLVRERPEFAPLLDATPSPPGLRRWLVVGSRSERAVLYEVLEPAIRCTS